MGLAEFILGKQNPFSQWVGQNKNMIRGWSEGLAEAPGFTQALQRGAGAGRLDDAEAIRQQQIQQAAAEKNQTMEWLQTNYPQYAGLPPAEGFQAAMKDMAQAQNGPATNPASVREWGFFNELTPEQQGQYLRMKRANPYLDIGTGFVQPDPVNPGQVSGGPIVKDNFTPAYDTAAGTATGKVDVETQASFDSLNSKMPGLKAVVSELGDLAEKATYTQAGQLWDAIVRETGQMPPEGAIARTKYMSMVDNQVLPLLRDTFGAAFTVQEGESLRATLGAPDKSPAEKKAVLEAFIEQKVRDLQALQSRLPGAGGAAPAGVNTTSTGVTWSVGP